MHDVSNKNNLLHSVAMRKNECRLDLKILWSIIGEANGHNNPEKILILRCRFVHYYVFIKIVARSCIPFCIFFSLNIVYVFSKQITIDLPTDRYDIVQNSVITRISY